MNFWTCFVAAFIVMAVLGIAAHKLISKYNRIGIYLFLIIGALMCPYGSVAWEILPTHESVNWLHKVFGLLGILAGVYCIIMLVLFIKSDMKSLHDRKNGE